MTALTIRNTGGTDHQSFDALGLPGFQFIQDDVEYGTMTHHTNLDSYERLQPSDMMKNATIAASFAYLAANRDERLPRKPFPPRRGRGGVALVSRRQFEDCRLKIVKIDWRRSRVLVPAAVYLLLALAWSWPLPLHLANRFTHDPGDPLLVTYLIWWNAQAVPLTRRVVERAVLLADARHAGADRAPAPASRRVTTPIQWLGRIAAARLQPRAHRLDVVVGARDARARAAADRVRRRRPIAPAWRSRSRRIAPASSAHMQLLCLLVAAASSCSSLHAYYEERRARWLILLGDRLAAAGTDQRLLPAVPAGAGRVVAGRGSRAGPRSAGRRALAARAGAGHARPRCRSCCTTAPCTRRRDCRAASARCAPTAPTPRRFSAPRRCFASGTRRSRGRPSSTSSPA